MANLKKPKQPADVRGNFIRCPKFIQCPLCYGCRAYKSSDLDCVECTINKKRDICNVSLHTDDIVSRFITKTNYFINEEVKFKSNNDGED